MGHPANFNGFRVLAALLRSIPEEGVSQTLRAVLNRGRHLYSAGRPSRWASAHILVFVLCLVATVGSLCSIITTRHRASTSMYSLTFCFRVMLPERHQWKPAVQPDAIMLRTPPSTASYRPAARADPAERSHYVVRSPDGRKFVTMVRVMLPWQRNPCTDCKSA